METKIERSNTVHNLLFNESVWHAVKMRANKANLSKKKSQPKLDANANNVENLNHNNSHNRSNNSGANSSSNSSNSSNRSSSNTPKRLSLPLDIHFKERFLSRISLTPKLSPSLESEPRTPVSKSLIRKSFVSTRTLQTERVLGSQFFLAFSLSFSPEKTRFRFLALSFVHRSISNFRLYCLETPEPTVC